MDPLVAHLVDILNAVPPGSVILGGGLGILLKREHLIHDGAATLAASAGHGLPESRATTDIDLFLRMDNFTMPDVGRQLRTALDGAGYTVRTEQWQFEKPLGQGTAGLVVVDLLARTPDADMGVIASGIRVGSGSGTGIHGRGRPRLLPSKIGR